MLNLLVESDAAVDGQGEQAVPIEFRLLGDVQARSGNREIDIGHARQRCVLAVLLVEANRPVPPDRLVDRVWGGGQPDRAQATLRSYLSRLRRLLAVDGFAIRRQPGGYAAVVDETAVDLHRFRRLVAQARSAGPDAVALLDRAVGLWRGEPFATLDTPWLNTVREELNAERLAAELDHADLRLRHGCHGELVAELAARAARHPLDERIAGQLMLALYRSGRQADALARYHQTRRRLAEEFGADPSPPLQRLHRGILTATVPTPTDPPTDPPTDAPRGQPSPPAEPPCSLAEVPLPRSPVAVVAARPVPRELPAPPAAFVGRERELDVLTSTLLDGAQIPAGQLPPGQLRTGQLPPGQLPAGRMPVAVIGGMPGIGKTWLALHWAHRHADRFPDGQLHADLHMASPVAVLRGFLDALGVERSRPPERLDDLARLYRSRLAGRRLLVVLDGAADTAQVAPLLPGTPGCAVVVTSRCRLSGLVSRHGARPVELGVLDADAARRLLARHAGRDRVAAHPAAVDELLRHCAGLPLALAILAAEAAAHPDFPLTGWADRLRDPSTRLDALDTAEPQLGVRAAFARSYRALTPPAARLLDQVATAGVDAKAAAAVTRLPGRRAAALLRELHDRHLLDQPTPGRYRVHELLRLYAVERAQDQPTGSRTGSGVTRCAARPVRRA